MFHPLPVERGKLFRHRAGQPFRRGDQRIRRQRRGGAERAEKNHAAQRALLPDRHHQFEHLKRAELEELPRMEFEMADHGVPVEPDAALRLLREHLLHGHAVPVLVEKRHIRDVFEDMPVEVVKTDAACAEGFHGFEDGCQLFFRVGSHCCFVLRLS